MNNKEQNKSMNYFLDKIVKTVKYFVFFILIGCNTCGKYNISNFKNNLDTFERVKNVIITSNLLENNNNNNEIALKILKASILSKDYLVLKKIGLNNIQIFKEVIVFKFSYKSDDNYFEKKIDTKLETKTTNKTCNHFLFYSKNNYSKLQVMSYPRYAECRKNYEEINAFWTYSSQLWYCDD
jgi:hypothetical protein